MTIDTENLINSIMESLGRIEFIKSEDIPIFADLFQSLRQLHD